MIGRGALAALLLWPACVLAEITGASYDAPTDVYGHGAVQNGEYETLVIDQAGRTSRLRLTRAVWEDTAPRLADLDGDGSPEVVAVRSGFTSGAGIVVIDEVAGDLAAVLETAPIGRRNRWLAIAAVADLDGDGRVEIAYVDRPHLAKVLRVIEVSVIDGLWTYRDEAAAEGFTNHQLGSPVIEGGLRTCDGLAEVITANANWTRIMATRLSDGQLTSRDIGPYTGADSLTDALGC
ncbi:VCBS repeat-containing protein [Loktanella sp. IMCC34160]|uniref:FG-GAP repeat domain-containing protein n=1 Tax=Loktanella sp. IMCC34160 TaxID=2510646 RepID=UPI00101CB8B6|nr:VCBS repeat-containing protein [Loktanella sp. IMCC34160]RYG89334.1 VCBS repeat-containing protein [Loktanella sp. IMCC34160]